MNTDLSPGMNRTFLRVSFSDRVFDGDARGFGMELFFAPGFQDQMAKTILVMEGTPAT